MNIHDNTDISAKTKERFCKDCNIPIKIFTEPYFTDRLVLFDNQFNSLRKWKTFTTELAKYNTEQDYFEELNKVKDNAINAIKNSAAYEAFNSEDMNKYAIKHQNLPNKDIYKPTFDGKTFISIDMKKANFSALMHYDKHIFFEDFDIMSTWEDFIGKFTSNKHIINSKHIRQIIMGNCNPKRHITYEKFLMDDILSQITNNLVNIDDIVFFSNDEIIIDISDMSKEEQTKLYDVLYLITDDNIVPLRVEKFTLHKIKGCQGYYKEIRTDINTSKIDFKCIDNYMYPFILRKFNNEDITESDTIFYNEGLLSKFIEIPEISF